MQVRQSRAVARLETSWGFKEGSTLVGILSVKSVYFIVLFSEWL